MSWLSPSLETARRRAFIFCASVPLAAVAGEGDQTLGVTTDGGSLCLVV